MTQSAFRSGKNSVKRCGLFDDVCCKTKTTVVILKEACAYRRCSGNVVLATKSSLRAHFFGGSLRRAPAKTATFVVYESHNSLIQLQPHIIPIHHTDSIISPCVFPVKWLHPWPSWAFRYPNLTGPKSSPPLSTLESVTSTEHTWRLM